MSLCLRRDDSWQLFRRTIMGPQGADRSGGVIEYWCILTVIVLSPASICKTAMSVEYFPAYIPRARFSDDLRPCRGVRSKTPAGFAPTWPYRNVLFLACLVSTEHSGLGMLKLRSAPAVSHLPAGSDVHDSLGGYLSSGIQG
jgi:hypothetical protein